MEILRTDNLTKRYRDNICVKNLDLKINSGEIYGFLGPNGAGKTTTIKMILGLVKPTEGHVRIFGKEHTEKNRGKILKNIGALVEEGAAYPHLTAGENLKLMCSLTDTPYKRIDQVLSTVKLSKVKNKRVKEFSLGMKQRLGIANALLKNPEFLILDEPTNGLDPSGIIEIRELIKEIPNNYGSTVLISSHLLSEIDQIATNIGVISEGELRYQGTMEEFRKMGKENIILKINRLEAGRKIINEMGIEGDITKDGLVIPMCHDRLISNIIKNLVKAQVDIYRIVERRTTLEEIFLDIVKEAGEIYE